MFSQIAPQAVPGGAGLAGPQNMQGFFGPNLQELQSTSDAIKQVVGPNYTGFDRYIQGMQLGMFTAGNMGVVYEPVPPATTFVHETIAPGLQELVSLFQLVKLDPTKQVIQKRFMVFNSSHWSRITDLMTGNQDMSTLFTSHASVIQFGKSAEMEIKAFKSREGATLWYNILKQAATGLINSMIHTCIAAILDCAPSRLAGMQMPLQPYAFPITFDEALRMSIDIFGILGKGTNSLLTLFQYAQEEAMRRGIPGFNSLICNKGTMNRVQRSLIANPSIIDSWRNVPTEQDAKMFVLKHSDINRVLEVGPVSIGPNSAKVLPFVRRVHILTHCIVPADRVAPGIRDFTTYDRLLDDFVTVRIADFHDQSGAAVEADCSYIVFFPLEVETESVVFLASGVEGGPELHMSSLLDAVAFHASQMKITYNAAISAAAHIPNKSTIFFAEHASIRRVLRAPINRNTLRLQDGTELNTNNCYAVKVRNNSIRNRNIVSVTGQFPARMTGENNIQCWGNAPITVNNLRTVYNPGQVVLPDAFDDEGTSFPYVSTQEYCFSQVGNLRHEEMCDGFFGQNCYKDCVKAITGRGIHRPFNNDRSSVALHLGSRPDAPGAGPAVAPAAGAAPVVPAAAGAAADRPRDDDVRMRNEAAVQQRNEPAVLREFRPRDDADVAPEFDPDDAFG